MVRVSSAIVALTLVVVISVLHIRHTSATCVLESDFGFKLNCAFKQSGLFRVRNLGGLKGYVGLGLSIGDELGFTQSLSNVEGNKRRSTSGGAFAAAAAASEASKRTSDGRAVALPMFRPIPANMPALRPNIPGSTRRVHQPAPVTTQNIPPFQALPESISRVSSTGAISKLSGVRAQTAFRNAIQTVNNQFMKPSIKDKSSIATNELITRTLANGDTKVQDLSSSIDPVLLDKNIEALAKASNVSADAIKAALSSKQHRQQLQQAAAAVALLHSTPAPPVYSPPTRPTTTPRPNLLNAPPSPQKISLVGPPRVMNAPKDYYPVGYDKDFDDGFKSRVELPPTSFACGEQKHFPGLYADEDLGCMVFHVCALTDDGLIQKSFLCPESTLFDQTILKCNWWFYVDCPSSKRLYDSNIPVSKSYQLMKALAFFSSYKS